MQKRGNMKKKNLICAVLGLAAVGGIGAAYANYAAYKKGEDKINRLDSYYHIMQKWIKSRQNGTSLKKVLEALECGRIAIYGMGILGELFYNEAKAEGIEVVGFVDKNAEILVEGIDGLPLMPIMEMEAQGVDSVIVTPIFAYDEIAAEIESICGTDINIISLDSIYSE